MDYQSLPLLPLFHIKSLFFVNLEIKKTNKPHPYHMEKRTKIGLKI